MSDAVPELHPSYWARSSQPVAQMPVPQPTVCRPCGAEFLIGARFCHVCGTERGALVRQGGIKRWLNWTSLEEVSGASRITLAFGFGGALCLMVAFAVGFVFRADTMVDWQAIQAWRIEWTLGAIAFFLLGMLLKKSR